MSAGDILITIATWLYNGAVGLLPVEIDILPLATFTGYLEGFKDTLISGLSAVTPFFPVDLLLIIFLIIMAGELILFGIKAGIFAINLIRGSGA